MSSLADSCGAANVAKQGPPGDLAGGIWVTCANVSCRVPRQLTFLTLPVPRVVIPWIHSLALRCPRLFGFGDSDEIEMSRPSVSHLKRRRGNVSSSAFKTLLRDISFCARPGTLTAIIGPSGCGKTSLLTLLCGRLSRRFVKGKVGFYGSPDPLIQFVAWKDIFLQNLTVEETLQSVADVKLVHHTKKERQTRVEKILRQVGLFGSRRTRVGGEVRKGLSTGELRRLSIAVEIIDEPDVLILDEPTSKVDSALATDLIFLLRAISRRGRTVILSIHQPNSQIFSLFDSVVLMSEGRVVYQGPPGRPLHSFFSSAGYECPVGYGEGDFYLQVLSPSPRSADIAYQLQCKYRESCWGKELVDDIRQRSDASFFRTKRCAQLRRSSSSFKDCVNSWISQTFTLAKRNFINTVRNPNVFLVAILSFLIEGLVIGAVFFQIPSRLHGIEPLPITERFMNTTWGSVYANGVDYKDTNQTYHDHYRPLVNSLVDGIDGVGSNPFEMLAKDEQLMTYVTSAVHCAYNAFELPSLGYPPITWISVPSDPAVIPWNSSSLMMRRSADDFLFNVSTPITRKLGTNFSDNLNLDRLLAPLLSMDTYELAADAMVVVQLVDYALHHVDQQPFFDCKKKTGLFVFLCLFTSYKSLINKAIYCLGFPKIPLVRRLFEKEKPLDEDVSLDFSLFPYRNLLPGEHLGDPLEKIYELHFPETLRFILEKGVRSWLENDYVRPIEQLQDEGRYQPIRPRPSEPVDTFIHILNLVTKCSSSYCQFLQSVLGDIIGVAADLFNTLWQLMNFSGSYFLLFASLSFLCFEPILSFPNDRAMFNRETANHYYRPSSFFVAKTISDMPFQIIPTICLATIWYLLSGMAPGPGPYFVLVGICLSFSFAAYGVCYLISAASPKLELAVYCVPPLFVAWLITAEFIMWREYGKWIHWFRYTSLHRYAFYAAISNESRNSAYWGMFPRSWMVFFSNVHDQSIWFNCIILVAYGFFYRLAGYIFLRYTNRKIGIEG